ncbi:MAG: threonine synthase [Oscillospiraceae bacterium]|nr:threonine synthase [Oscillospiraceae bacterium]
MNYQSTRNAKITASSTAAVLQGLADDGGLFITKDFGSFDWRGTLQQNAFGMAEAILGALLPDFDDMPALVRRAYTGKFETDELTPLVKVGSRYVLELFRGPTSAFKDVALSMLPQLITAARAQEGVRDEILILTATSGDTGKAALAGFRDVPGTKIIVFYPDAGVSKVQKAQMVTQEGENVCVCAVRGNFDDTQTGVKRIFAAGLPEGSGVRLSSANSINIGRLAPQVVYYFKAYANLLRSGRIHEGDQVDYVVPTGNFGDILAGYLAKRMGLPVGRLVCASNRNDVLTDFLRTGVYDRRRPFYKTISPSMDILVSSNLERLLYLLCEDENEVAGYMRDLNEQGAYTVSDAMLEKLHGEFGCGCCDDVETKETIGRVWKEHGYLMDTHTAVAWKVAEGYESGAPVVVLSTASPYKFPAAVLSAIGGDASGDEFEIMDRLHTLTGVPVPQGLATLRSKPVRHTDVIDREAMQAYVLGKVEHWK